MTYADLMTMCGISVDDFTKDVLDDAKIDNQDTRDKVKKAIKDEKDKKIDENIPTRKKIEDSAKDDIDKKQDELEGNVDLAMIAASSPAPPVLSGSGASNFTKASLKTNVKTEGIVIRNKKTKTKIKAENADAAHISPGQNYPNSSAHIDPLGNFVKINKKTGQVDIAHFSGTIIQITKSGTVNIHTKKDLKHIVEGNYVLEVKGDTNIKTNNLILETKKSEETTKEKITKSTNHTITAENLTATAQNLSLTGGSATMAMSGSDSTISGDKMNMNTKQMTQKGNMKVQGKTECKDLKASKMKADTLQTSGSIKVAGCKGC